MSLSDNNQADVIEGSNSTSRYLDDLLNIDNLYFEQMVALILLNQVNSFDPLGLSITNALFHLKFMINRMILSLYIVVHSGLLVKEMQISNLTEIRCLGDH